MPILKRSRPQHFPYAFGSLLDFPRRLVNPPKPGVGTVRSFKITPIYDVSLYDVLDGKHLPPLGLKEFEEYLLFVEHSAENLYFIFWLRGYIEKYNTWQDSIASIEPEKRPTSDPALTIFFSRARGTFFDSASHLELNLPAELVEALLTAKTSNPHPHPDAFSDIQKQVESMLRESLMKFVSTSCGNSGRRRGLFGIFVGLVAMAVGLAPLLLSVLDGRSRWIRLGALLPFWFGAMVVIASLHGVCVIIFLFGDARQLYPFELARPSIPAPAISGDGLLPLPVTMGGSFEPASPNMKQDASKQSFGGSDMQRVTSNSSTDQKRTLASPSKEKSKPQSGWEPYDETAGFISNYSGSISSGTTAATPIKFDFDSLPTIDPSEKARTGYEHRTLPKTGVFCSLTRVVSPVVTRAQWEIVMRSAIMGVFVALIIGGACFAIPPKRS